MKPYLKAVLGGMIISDSIRSLWADAIGKDQYLKLMSDGWAPAHITVPLSIVMLVIAFTLVAQASKNNGG